MRPVSPALPFQPLHDVVAGRTRLSRTGINAQGLAALGWTSKSWQNKAWYRAQASGKLTEDTADRLACDLGLHPAEIWGESWWELTSQETPWRVPSLLRLDKALRVARQREAKARRIPRHTTQELRVVFDEAFPESLLVKRQRLADLGDADLSWSAERASASARKRVRSDAARGLSRIPTQRPAPDRQQVSA